ncbi:unnamed protein product [Hydatigera taeniaeformis]|uniref:Secreted protein n=1 Tax=Hydatigena taeniaeformis TaxID=6205 RepID=A0A0R3WTD3_HYDTA|nr:unnamed protein product [Hydatigera taeniaeformis]
MVESYRTATFTLLLICLIYTGAGDASHQKDLIQPHEKHLEGVPVFIQQPESTYYAWRGKPAVFECTAEPVSHAVVFCADKTFPYMGNEHTSEERLQVTRLDSNGNLDADGPRWHLSLPVRTKDLEEWFDAYICTCEVWNLIPALKQVKKVFSRNATIIEACKLLTHQKLSATSYFAEAAGNKQACQHRLRQFICILRNQPKFTVNGNVGVLIVV